MSFSSLGREFNELRSVIKAAYRRQKTEASQRQSLQFLGQKVETADSLLALEELNTLFNNANEQAIKPKLKEFLQKRWEAIRGTYLSYTSLPNSELTKSCCAIANYLAATDQAKTPAIAFLMPSLKHFDHVVTGESLRDLPLEQAISLHVSSDNGESLIPLNLLTYLSFESDHRLFTNPYIGDGTQPLSISEKERLIHYSDLTEGIVNSVQSYKEEAAAGSSLYSALEKLIAGFRKSGEHGLGVGTADEAGMGAHLARAEFLEYWKELTPSQKKIAFEVEGFKEAFEKEISNPNFQDCVEVLAKKIEAIITENRKLFTQINLNENKKNYLLEKYEKKFQKSKDELTALCETDKHIASQNAGRDKLFLSAKQVKSWVKADDINNEDDVLLMMKNLRPHEIESIDENFKNKIIGALYDNKGLFNFLLNLDLDQLKAFTSVMSVKITDLLIASNSNIILANGINVLSDSAAEVFFRSAQNYFGGDLSTILVVYDNLSESKQSIFMNQMIHTSLTALTEDVADFTNFMRRFPEKEKVNYYTVMQDKLITLVDEHYKFTDVMSVLPTDEKGAFYESMKKKLHKMIKNDSAVFIELMSSLPELEQEDFFELTKKDLRGFVKNNFIVKCIYEILPEAKKTAFLQFPGVKNKLPELTEDYPEVFLPKSKKSSGNSILSESEQLSQIKSDLKRLEKVFLVYSKYLEEKLKDTKKSSAVYQVHRDKLNEINVQLKDIKDFLKSSPHTAGEFQAKMKEFCTELKSSGFTYSIEKRSKSFKSFVSNAMGQKSSGQKFIEDIGNILKSYQERKEDLNQEREETVTRSSRRGSFS